ncbi:MAG: DUF2142 domain-containing protein [Cellulomonadaceae bacterium]
MSPTDASHARPGPLSAARRLVAAPWSPRRAALTFFVAMFAVSGMWALANPLMASIDEPAHVTKAVVTVRGISPVNADAGTTGVGVVEVPEVFARLSVYANCFAFKPDVTVACQGPLGPVGDASAWASTSAINYNPLYYTVVGWTSLLPAGEHTVYLMRLATALVTSAVMALGVRLVAGLRQRRWLALAIVLPLTPTFVNLLGSVNPQSFEVAGAFLLWVSLLVLLHSEGRQLQLALVAVSVATVLLANARSLGPFMVVLILVLCVLSAPWERTRTVLQHRQAWWAAGVCVLACGLSVAWTVTREALPEGTEQAGLSARTLVMETLGLTSAYLQQMLLVLGWADVAVPLWLIFAMVACIGLALMIGWAVAGLRMRLVGLLCAAVVMGLPVAAHVVQANKIGLFWQGRYAFPVSIGLIALAALATTKREQGLPEWFSAQVTSTVLAVFAALHVVVLYLNTRRYATGADGSWLLREPLSWTPVPALSLILLYAAAWAALTSSVLRATNPPTRISTAMAAAA